MSAPKSPRPESARHSDAVFALTALTRGGFKARFAGGCVRDRLLGLEPLDYDVATDARPEQVISLFRHLGRRTVPTGVDHGTVTLIMPTGPIEITTLRRDVATDGRRAEVAFGDSFRDDAARRDFTINGMFEDALGRIYDDVGGQADLAAGVLRFVGDAGQRIAEDYLRILRLFRFWARFSFAPAPGTLEEVTRQRLGLNRISQERITAELLKTLVGPHAVPALAALAETGVLTLVMPELQPLAPSWVASPATWADRLRRWGGGGERRPQAQGPATGILAGLLLAAGIREPSVATACGERLRLPKSATRGLAGLLHLHGALLSDQTLAEPAAALDVVDFAERAGGRGAWSQTYGPILVDFPEVSVGLKFVDDAERQHGPRRIAKLPITGHSVSRHLGVTAGPLVGEALAALKRAFRNGEWRSREEGLAWLANWARETPAVVSQIKTR